MSLGCAAGVLLKPQTALQHLLEDINFQRNKEMRQLLKDDSGFVVLQGTTYWTDLFVRHFLFQSEPVHSIDSDDLLFFVRKKHVKSSSRHMPKYETEVDVFRKDSRKLPIGDPDVDWEETVYLNMIIHQFDYTLTLAICTRTSPKELQVLRRHSQRVYASPSRRKMDTKGEGEEITYPHICFMVDNFDEVFSDILVRDGEMVCVELVANDKDGAVQGVIFLGSIRYDALKKVYDARQSSLSSKVAQRMSFGLFSSGAGVQTRCEFVRMKGPQGKGHAEMAVTKPKGSGVETPTSEPGFSATDIWDDWDDENDDYCAYRHQRRLSDPSANINNFSRYAWRTKISSDTTSVSACSKARSENEGLDSLANEVSEIEAGDLKDDLCPAFSASEAKIPINQDSAELKALLVKKKTSYCQIEDLTQVNSPNQEASSNLEQNGIQNIIEATSEIIVVASSSSVDSKPIGCGGNCFKTGLKYKKSWMSNSDENTPQMSEIYYPTCESFANETPACLSKMSDTKLNVKSKSILNVENELVVTNRVALKFSYKKVKSPIGRSSSLGAADRRLKKPDLMVNKKDKSKIKDKDNAIKEKAFDQKKDTKGKIKEKIAKTGLLAKVSPMKSRNQKPVSNIGKAGKPKAFVKNKEKNINNNGETEKVNSAIQLEKTTKETSNSFQEYEIADDAISLNGVGDVTHVTENIAKMIILSESDIMITVRGKEELPVAEQSPTPHSPTFYSNDNKTKVKSAIFQFEKCCSVSANKYPLQTTSSHSEIETYKNDEVLTNIDNNTIYSNIGQTNNKLKSSPHSRAVSSDDCNGNCNNSTSCSSSPLSPPFAEDLQQTGNFTSTSPRTKRIAAIQTFYNRAIHLVPKRRTPDGTSIHYWCDFPEKSLKELDDGAYNPLWTSRGFVQSFHFWKENRRQQSTPLNAFLTYVTLPWWSIAKDLLDHRETPILTF